MLNQTAPSYPTARRWLWLSVLTLGCPGAEPSLMTGGAGSGGTDTTNSGGMNVGGMSVGGMSTGGMSTGGTGTGGCDPSSPALKTDKDNCGECGRACSAAGVMKRHCIDGLCVPECDATHIDRDRDDALANDGCEILVRRVFVTSEPIGIPFVQGLSALEGADSVCQEFANSAGVGGTWMAWLSIPDNMGPSLEELFLPPEVGYVRLDKEVVAYNWPDLVDGDILNPIEITEFNSPIANTNHVVWTGTNPSGQPTDESCGDWSIFDGATTAFGNATKTDGAWTQATDAAAFHPCGAPARLYCIVH